MFSRVWLVAALLVSPSWAQEPAPAVTDAAASQPLAYDFGTAAIRQIVRDTAATQSGQFQLAEPTPVEPPGLKHIELYAPAKAKAPAPARKRTPPPPEPSQFSLDGFLRQAFEILLEETLFGGHTVDFDERRQNPRASCDGVSDINASSYLWATCPLASAGTRP